MKKVIRCLTLSAAGIMVLSTIALLIAIIFQVPLVEMKYGFTPGEGFSIPFEYIVPMMAMIFISAALCFTAGNDKIGPWSEILSVALISVCVPVITALVSIAQNFILARFFTSSQLTWHTLAAGLCSSALTFVDFAEGMLLVACGISIAYKYLTRKAAPQETICE